MSRKPGYCLSSLIDIDLHRDRYAILSISAVSSYRRRTSGRLMEFDV